MILHIDDIKNVCSKIMASLDSSEATEETSVIELKTIGSFLHLKIANSLYTAKGKIALEVPDTINVRVNANKFLKLIEATSTETVDLKVVDNTLNIKANGNYKLPVIELSNGGLKEITIENVINNFEVASSTLKSILTFNAKEMSKGTINRPVQKMFYIDNFGAITYNTGACVNNFSLAEAVKFVLPDKIVKLFKLFDSETTKITFGKDNISEDIIQSKLKFETDDFEITALVSCDDVLLNSVPAGKIREMANAEYDYTVSINKDMLSKALLRLSILNSDKQAGDIFVDFNFYKDSVEIADLKSNKESIAYNKDADGLSLDTPYTGKFKLADFKITVDTCCEETLVFGFGNHRAMVAKYANIINVIPEASTRR